MRPTGRIALYARQLIKAGALLTGSALALAGCTAPAAGTFDPANNPAVNSAKALALFEAVCVQSYPSFDDAFQRMTTNGISIVGGNGIVYSNTDNLSMKLVPDANGRKSCSMVFATRESNESVTSSFAAFGNLTGSTTNQLSVRLPNGGTAILATPPLVSDGLAYHNIRLSSLR